MFAPTGCNLQFEFRCRFAFLVIILKQTLFAVQKYVIVGSTQKFSSLVRVYLSNGGCEDKVASRAMPNKSHVLVLH